MVQSLTGRQWNKVFAGLVMGLDYVKEHTLNKLMDDTQLEGMPCENICHI